MKSEATSQLLHFKDGERKDERMKMLFNSCIRKLERHGYIKTHEYRLINTQAQTNRNTRPHRQERKKDKTNAVVFCSYSLFCYKLNNSLVSSPVALLHLSFVPFSGHEHLWVTSSLITTAIATAATISTAMSTRTTTIPSLAIATTVSTITTTAVSTATMPTVATIAATPMTTLPIAAVASAVRALPVAAMAIPAVAVVVLAAVVALVSPVVTVGALVAVVAVVAVGTLVGGVVVVVLGEAMVALLAVGVVVLASLHDHGRKETRL